MYLNRQTFATAFLKTTSIALGLVILCGCESTEAQKVRPGKAIHKRTVAVTDLDEDRTVTQSRYDAQIAARTGRRVGSRFTQVSLFGELPGLSTTSIQVQAGKSIQQHTFATEGECFDPRVSPDGKWLAFASTQNTLKPEIYIKPIHSTAITQITSNPASDVQAAFSPESKRLAFCSDRTGNWDIYVIDIDGRNLQQLTDDPAPEMHPSFSLDGMKLTYCRYNVQSKQWEVWLLDANNPGQRKFLAAGLFPSFSPIENKIVYQRPAQRGSQLFGIWSITLGSDDQPSPPTQIADGSDRALIGPQWSANGKKIVYCSVLPGKNQGASLDAQIWVIDPNGMGRMPVTDQGISSFSPTWGSDNRIYFCTNRGDNENIWSVSPMGENSVSARTARARPASGESAVADNDGAATSEIVPNRPVHLKADSNITADARE
ncbi:MAG: hypothetical protein WC975_07505 [Phycisphaerae bacterium]